MLYLQMSVAVCLASLLCAVSVPLSAQEPSSHAADDERADGHARERTSRAHGRVCAW